MALRQNTGGQFFNTVPLIDDTDFKTPENGLAASVEASLEIAKNSGVMGPATGATVALNSNGTYRVTLTSGNVDTAGDLDWQVFVAGALIAYGSQIVYAGTGYDLLFGAATLDVNITEISGTAVTETSSGNLAGNFSNFYDNADAATTKVVDDVGTSVLTGPTEAFSVNRTLVAGSETGVHTNTHELDSVFWKIDDSTGINAELLYNIDAGNSGAMKSYQFYIIVSAKNNRFVDIALYDYIGAQFVDFRRIADTGGVSILQNIGTIPPEYTDSNGDVRIRFLGVSTGAGDSFSIDYATAVYESDTGTIPSASEIAYEVDLTLSGSHGSGIWNGLDLNNGRIDTVTNQTEIIISNGPLTDDIYNGAFILIESAGNPTEFGGAYITDWDGAFGILQFSPAMPFTIVANDPFRIIANPPVDLDAIKGVKIPDEVTPGDGYLARNFGTFYRNSDADTTNKVDEVGNLTRIMDVQLTDPSGGRLAGNFETFYGNADAATTKKVDDVGGVAGGVTDVNIVKILGKTLTETTSGLVGDNFSDFFDAGGSALGGSNAGGINLASGPSNQSILSGAYNNTDVDPTSGLAVSDLNNILLSAMLGRMLYNPDTGNTEWYAFDNVTLLYEVNTSIVVGDNDTERTRLSYTAPPPPP